MVEKAGVALFVLVAVVGVAALIVGLRADATGEYVYSGGGKYYYGTVNAQLQPDEACTYSGYQDLYPWQVRTNEYGTLVSVCRDGSRYVEVPINQVIIVPHAGGQPFY